MHLQPGQEVSLRTLCRAHRLRVLDTLDRQLADLAMVRLPGGDEAARRAFVADQMSPAGDAGAYGCWAYFPWARDLVHLLEPDGYFDVVTNRSMEKLTRQELLVLRTKRIGVMGLSVGGEAAVALAQEHLCGEMVLADFDRLDLSNLNRLGAGCDELGLPKTHIVARRIARLDPYLRVTIFPDGVTDANAGRFLDGLDLLVEECDGLGMKHEVRRLAKERRLDVVYAADERGFLSVEPYGSHPDLPLFHGRVPQRQPERAAFPTPLAFMRALAEWLGGWDEISDRSRLSLERIGTTLCGYPQLASEARTAAGQIGHVARRLLLGERLAPFVGALDLAPLLDTIVA